MFITDVGMLACVDMYARFRNAWGLRWLYYGRKHMFSADRGGERGATGRSSTAAQRKQKRKRNRTAAVIDQAACEVQLGGQNSIQ